MWVNTEAEHSDRLNSNAATFSISSFFILCLKNVFKYNLFHV